MWEEIHTEVDLLKNTGEYDIHKAEVPAEGGVAIKYTFHNRQVEVYLTGAECKILHTGINKKHTFGPEQQSKALGRLRELLACL